MSAVVIQRMWRRHRPTPSTARVMADVRARLLVRIPEGAGTFVAVARDPAVLRAVAAALRLMSAPRRPRALLAAFAVVCWPSLAPPMPQELRDAAGEAVHAFMSMETARGRAANDAARTALVAYEAAVRAHVSQ